MTITLLPSVRVGSRLLALVILLTASIARTLAFMQTEPPDFPNNPEEAVPSTLDLGGNDFGDTVVAQMSRQRFLHSI